MRGNPSSSGGREPRELGNRALHPGPFPRNIAWKEEKNPPNSGKYFLLRRTADK